MAWRLDAQADVLSRTASLPTTTAFTTTGWARRRGAGGSSDSGVLCGFHDATLANFIAIIHGQAASNVEVAWSGFSSASVKASGVPVDQWFFFAMSCSGTGGTDLKGYAALPSESSIATASGTGQSFTPTRLGWSLDDATYWCDQEIAAIKVWDAALTADEIAAERWTYLPRRTANLHLWQPGILHTDLFDLSGNGRTLTAGGTLATADGPPISWGGKVLVYPFAGAAAATYAQHSFRIRNDDGSETTATWKAPLNINAGAAVSSQLRVRFLIDRTG